VPRLPPSLRSRTRPLGSESLPGFRRTPAPLFSTREESRDTALSRLAWRPLTLTNGGSLAYALSGKRRAWTRGRGWRVQFLLVKANVLDPVFVLRRTSKQELRALFSSAMRDRTSASKTLHYSASPRPDEKGAAIVGGHGQQQPAASTFERHLLLVDSAFRMNRRWCARADAFVAARPTLARGPDRPCERR